MCWCWSWSGLGDDHLLRDIDDDVDERDRLAGDTDLRVDLGQRLVQRTTSNLSIIVWTWVGMLASPTTPNFTYSKFGPLKVAPNLGIS